MVRRRVTVSIRVRVRVSISVMSLGFRYTIPQFHGADGAE